jgi:hypothetical protein
VAIFGRVRLEERILMARIPGNDVVDRIEQFDRNDSQIKWGSNVRPSPVTGSLIPVELVDERLAKMERAVGILKRDCRTLNDSLLRQKRMNRIYMMVAVLVGIVAWATSSVLFGGR